MLRKISVRERVSVDTCGVLMKERDEITGREMVR